MLYEMTKLVTRLNIYFCMGYVILSNAICASENSVTDTERANSLFFYLSW